jgi:hypothetical protein
MGICEKHGLYSTFCRACDLDTIKEHTVFTTLQEVDHYKFIEKYGKLFASLLDIKHIIDMDHFSSAEGDKTRQYKEQWGGYRIPFPMATMVYYLSKEHPYCSDNRNTQVGWVPVEQWVISAILGIPKNLEGVHYENLRIAYVAVLQQYAKDIGL